MHSKLQSFSPIIISLFLLMSLIITLTKSTPVPVNSVVEEKRRRCIAQQDRCETDGIVPIEILNSRYMILSDSTLCCPLYASYCDGTPSCLSKERMERTCREERGTSVVHEPCHLCWTCAKRKGEICGGTQNMHGSCESDHRCLIRGKMVTDLSGKDNRTGICISTETSNRIFGESCGGAYGSLGICEEGLRCSVEQKDFLAGDDIQGFCFHNNSVGACFKNCMSKSISPLCGTDGVWYRNLCSLRFQNCWERTPKIRRAGKTTCNGAYTEPTPPPTPPPTSLPITPSLEYRTGNGVEAGTPKGITTTVIVTAEEKTDDYGEEEESPGEKNDENTATATTEEEEDDEEIKSKEPEIEMGKKF